MNDNLKICKMETLTEQQQLEINALANIGRCVSLLTETVQNGSSFVADDLDAALAMIGDMVRRKLLRTA